MTQQYRILLLDRDEDDPHWVVATVTGPDSIIPAVLDPAGRYVGWAAVAEWAAIRLGEPVELTPVHDALAWTIRPARGRPA